MYFSYRIKQKYVKKILMTKTILIIIIIIKLLYMYVRIFIFHLQDLKAVIKEK